ncbi:MAG: hypothetical protein ACKPKO_10690, partial [Candidatus Fonsibacter sp.]
ARVRREDDQHNLTQVDIKLLRTSTVNNLAMSVCFMDSIRNKRIVALMVLVPEPLARWQQRSAASCRSVAGNLEWLLSEMATGFLAHQCAVLAQLEDPVVVERCGFLQEQYDGMEDHEVHGLIEAEDEFAQLAGHLAAGVVSRRHRRLAYMTNQWPNKAALLLHSAEAGHRVAADLKLDYELYEHMRKREAPGKIVMPMLYRSAFQTTAVDQLVAGHAAAMWEPSAE